MPRERAIATIIKHIESMEPAILIVGLAGTANKLLTSIQGYACIQDKDCRR